MDAGVPEADAGKYAGQVHAGARLQVLGVAHGSGRRGLSAGEGGATLRRNAAHRFMNLATIRRAWHDHTSLMGLLPW